MEIQVTDVQSMCCWRAPLAVLVLLAFTAGCDRPFRDVEPPSIQVISPDSREVVLSESILLTLTTESFRGIDRVMIGTRDARFDQISGHWSDTVDLAFGVNRIRVAAFDREGIARVDTLSFVRMGIGNPNTQPALPEPRGGHTATMLADGRILITGGAERASGAGLADVFILDPPFQASRFLAGLQSPRVGHTATRLPDGRLLILGGARSSSVEDLSDLVESVEIFDPATGSFTEIPVIGDPIRRAYHTTTLYDENDEIIIDLYGGIGDISFGGGGRLGIRRDVRSFVFHGTSLEQRTSQIGSVLLDPLMGHAQVSLTEAIRRIDELSLITGSRFFGSQFETTSLVLDYTRPNRFVQIRDVGPVITPRMQHAAVLLRRGAVLLYGGRRATLTDLVDHSELYIHEEASFFLIPGSVLPRAIFGHTATKLPDGRILFIGGFDQNAEALSNITVVSARI